MENEVVGALTQADFGLIALFFRASLAVKIVMIILVIASIWAWSVAISKWLLVRSLRNNMSDFLEAFRSGITMDELYKHTNTQSSHDMESVFRAGMRQWRKSYSDQGAFIDGAEERIEKSMLISLSDARQDWEEGTGILATIGSTAPFIGLFGTVWGIKTSFQDIAVMRSTDLAVVAPGIAEALVATAIGLVAAIPAVIFYNKFSRDFENISSSYLNFIDEFGLLVSRQIKKRGDF